MRKILAGLVAVLVAGPALAGFRPALTEERARYGATHVATLSHSDLTNATAATAQTVPLFKVSAKQGVELVAVLLDDAYDAGASTSALTVAIGDGNDPDRFLTATQVAGDDTEVFLAYGRQSSEAASITQTKQDLMTGITPAGRAFLLSGTPGTESVLNSATPATETVIQSATPAGTDFLVSGTPGVQSVVASAAPAGIAFVTGVEIVMDKDGPNVTNVSVNLTTANAITGIVYTATDAVTGIVWAADSAVTGIVYATVDAVTGPSTGRPTR